MRNITEADARNRYPTAKLEDLRRDAAVRGILADCLITVVGIKWYGSAAIELTYKDPARKLGIVLLYRDHEPSLEVVDAGRPWSFDGDGKLFRLVSEAYARVRGADEKSVSPGDGLRLLFNRFSPYLILIGDWVAYARQPYNKPDLPAGDFDAHFTFAQTLSESAKLADKTLLVISTPASQNEIGGEGGQAALERLKNVIERVERYHGGRRARRTVSRLCGGACSRRSPIRICSPRGTPWYGRSRTNTATRNSSRRQASGRPSQTRITTMPQPTGTENCRTLKFENSGLRKVEVMGMTGSMPCFPKRNV